MGDSCTILAVKGIKMRTSTTQIEYLQSIVASYRASGEQWPAPARIIADWANENGLFESHADALMTIYAEMIRRAMREEYVRDPQGRTVRAKHSARMKIDGKQMCLWDDIRTASRSFMQVAFQNRRRGIVADCHQLKIDIDSYNENYNRGASIPLVLDFGPDIAEIEVMGTPPTFNEEDDE
jgi:hypothetical protein